VEQNNYFEEDVEGDKRKGRKRMLLESPVQD